MLDAAGRVGSSWVMGVMVMVGIAACGGDDGSAVPDAPSDAPVAEVVFETACGSGFIDQTTMNSKSIVFACNENGSGVTVTTLDLADLSSRVVYQDFDGHVSELYGSPDTVVFRAQRAMGGDQVYALSSGADSHPRPLLADLDGRVVEDVALTPSFAYLLQSFRDGSGGYKQSIVKVDLGATGQVPQPVMDLDYIEGTYRALAISSEHLFLLETSAAVRILFRIDLSPPTMTSLYSRALDSAMPHQTEFFAALDDRVLLTYHDTNPYQLLVQRGSNSTVMESQYMPNFASVIVNGFAAAIGQDDYTKAAILDMRNLTYRPVLRERGGHNLLFGSVIGSVGDFAYGFEPGVVVKYPLGPIAGP